NDRTSPQVGGPPPVPMSPPVPVPNEVPVAVNEPPVPASGLPPSDSPPQPAAAAAIVSTTAANALRDRAMTDEDEREARARPSVRPGLDAASQRRGGSKCRGAASPGLAGRSSRNRSSW